MQAGVVNVKSKENKLSPGELPLKLPAPHLKGQGGEKPRTCRLTAAGEGPITRRRKRYREQVQIPQDLTELNFAKDRTKMSKTFRCKQFCILRGLRINYAEKMVNYAG